MRQEYKLVKSWLVNKVLAEGGIVRCILVNISAIRDS